MAAGESVSVVSGLLRAIEILNEIIDSLKECVELKHRKMRTRSGRDLCFTGSDAVNVVLHQLMTGEDNLPKKDLRRAKAVMLCQFMLERKVFEAVKRQGSTDKPRLFEDSTCKLYRFLEDKENTAKPLTHHKCQELFDPDIQQWRERDVQQLLDLTESLQQCNSGVKKKKPASLDHCLIEPNLKRTSKAEDELMWEHALSHLLRLLEIPVLDNILSYEAIVAKPSAKRQANLNLAFINADNVSSSSLHKGDPWWNAAVHCMKCIPNGEVILEASQKEKSALTQKLRLYQMIADYYRSLLRPLWPDNFVSVHVGLFNLLMQGRRDQVFRGLHLAIVLLARDVHEELKRLLLFLHQAVSDDALSLSSRVDNCSLIESAFTPVIIKNKVLAPHQAGQLVVFMIHEVDRLWEKPEELQESVKKSLLERHEGKEELNAAKPCCAQVSQDEFNGQREELTEQSLVDLVNAVLDDTKVALKDKKRKMKQLQKHHPKIYWKHFSDML